MSTRLSYKGWEDGGDDVLAQGAGAFCFSRCETNEGRWTKTMDICEAFLQVVCVFFCCFLNNGTGSNGQIVGVHSWWHLCCWELIQQSSRMEPFVPACGIVKHWLGRVRAMTRLETITKPQPAVLFQWLCTVFLKPKVGYVGYGPFPVRVTTRIIPFLVGNPYKPLFATGILGRGHTKGICSLRSPSRVVLTNPGRPLAEAKVEDLRTAVDCAAFFGVPSLYGTPGVSVTQDFSPGKQRYLEDHPRAWNGHLEGNKFT